MEFVLGALLGSIVATIFWMVAFAWSQMPTSRENREIGNETNFVTNCALKGKQ